MLARRPRVALLLLSLAALGASACVRGRNDGGKEAAGNASNGAGPAPQPGPIGGQNTDTTTLAPATSGATVVPAGATPAAAATKKAP
ncbi:MAG: hypothetical protein JO180_06995 [Gemmatirosa sp.]|nr:hypothetical protein [Gemmatirosa sp.]